MGFRINSNRGFSIRILRFGAPEVVWISQIVVSVGITQNSGGSILHHDYTCKEICESILRQLPAVETRQNCPETAAKQHQNAEFWREMARLAPTKQHGKGVCLIYHESR